MIRSAPDFLIVGTPRSGTTLVQRMASELPGVVVTPETHFFPLVDEELGGVRNFPRSRAGLRILLTAYCEHPLTKGLDLDPEHLIDRLSGRTGDPYEVFATVVSELAGPAAVVGEKTPDHLHWWRPLARADDRLKIIRLIRDPRAVAASMLTVPFGMDHADLIASQWVEDARVGDRARHHLGERMLDLRYEDVVQDPHDTQERLAALLAVNSTCAHGEGTSQIGPGQLFPDWELSWKSRALQPASLDRISAWESSLTSRQVAEVERIAGGTMGQWGYVGTGGGAAPVSVRDRSRLAWHRLLRRRRQRRIDRISIGAGR